MKNKNQKRRLYLQNDELYFLFSEIYSDEESRVKAVQDARKARFFVMKNEFADFNEDSGFNDENFFD